MNNISIAAGKPDSRASGHYITGTTTDQTPHFETTHHVITVISGREVDPISWRLSHTHLAVSVEVERLEGVEQEVAHILVHVGGDDPPVKVVNHTAAIHYLGNGTGSDFCADGHTLLEFVVGH